MNHSARQTINKKRHVLFSLKIIKQQQQKKKQNKTK